MVADYSFLENLGLGLGLAGLAASLVEALVFIFIVKRPYDWRAALASLGVNVGRRFGNLIPLAIAMPGAEWLYAHRMLEPEKLGGWSFALLFLGLEFVYYWWHRICHRSRWFWTTHFPHHTSNELNLSAAYRIGWTTRIMATYVVFMPMILLGFDPVTVFAAYTLNLAYQVWIHVDWIPKLGFLEGIVNTPSAHRVHHAANLEYLDANYGGMFMIFDRLFGTYRAERDAVPVRYGLVTPLHSYNPFRIALYPLLSMLRDLRGARTTREVFGYLFGPPGWLPDGNGATTENLRRRAMLLAADTTTSPLSNARGGDENAKAMIVDSGGLAR